MTPHRIRITLIAIFLLSSSAIATTVAATETTCNYVASIHPLAAILRELTIGRANIDCFLAPGSSPHTFEPTPSDLKTIENAQAFFYVGPGLDEEWVRKIPLRQKVSMLNLVPPDKQLQMVDKHGHHHHPGEEENQDEKKTIDPHFWTDPLTVKAMVPKLVAQLCAIDPAGKTAYTTNGEKFLQRLDQLDQELRNILKPLANEPLLLFHPSFNYLFSRYNLRSAGVVIEAPGREPSPKFLFMLVKRIKEEKIRALFTEPQLAAQPAQVLAESAGIPVYELDPIGGVSGRESYPGLLLYNGVTLAKALH